MDEGGGLEANSKLKARHAINFGRFIHTHAGAYHIGIISKRQFYCVSRNVRKATPIPTTAETCQKLASQEGHLIYEIGISCRLFENIWQLVRGLPKRVSGNPA